MITIKMLNADGSYSVAAEDEGNGFRIETSTMIFDVREGSGEATTKGGLRITVNGYPLFVMPEGWNIVTLLGPKKGG